MGLNFEGWVKGTHASYGNDPTEWNGKNTPCKLCEKDAENMDEYCEDHQRCFMCGDNDDCSCKEEWDTRSNCCEARIRNPEMNRCSCCGKYCKSVWQHYTQDCKV